MKRGERGRGMPGARRVRGSSSGITPVGVHVVGVGREESSQRPSSLRCFGDTDESLLHKISKCI